LNFLIRKRE